MHIAVATLITHLVLNLRTARCMGCQPRRLITGSSLNASSSGAHAETIDTMGLWSAM